MLSIYKDRSIDSSINLSNYKKRFTFSGLNCHKPHFGPSC